MTPVLLFSEALVMLPAMPRKPLVTIVGPGRLGTALTAALHNAGYKIDEVVTRPATRSRNRAAKLSKPLQAKIVSGKNAKFRAEVVWICVPDAAIRETARQLAAAGSWKGKFVFHSSGALTSSELSELKKRGAAVASVHPMMSFVYRAAPSLAGVSFAVEGDPAALRMANAIVKDLGGVVITIAAAKKALYHAFGAFTSPLMISTLAIAEKVAQAAGLSQGAARKAMLPIVIQTIRNYSEQGAPGAFSGPLIRGDVGTVRRNVASLKNFPEAQQAYIALSRAALRLLPAANRKKLQQALKDDHS
jgi:predicted short-subunit dehydrogenase-like oxidoreductase (DUF2520 family)